MKRASRGFTIVELLIVIVVIAILAAITVVAYNGIQSRGRDAQRVSDLNRVYKAILNYQTINGSLPSCAGYTQCASQPSPPSGVHHWQSLNIKPEQISSIPVDPLNTNNEYGYYYARGHAMNSSATSVVYTGLVSDFILVTRLENPKGPTFGLWGNVYLNYYLGSKQSA